MVRLAKSQDFADEVFLVFRCAETAPEELRLPVQLLKVIEIKICVLHWRY